MKNIKVFILGMLEFNQSVTSNVPDNMMEIYEYGRDFMHRLTLRKFDEV
jgi:hypothetical protein